MKRSDFLKRTLGGVIGMSTLNELKAFSAGMSNLDREMPALFVGHGSPMNGIEDNAFSLQWEKLGKTLPLPRAVLVISAHWYTRGTFVTAVNAPETIYDFQGFPPALYEVSYPAPGSPALAKTTSEIITKTTVGLDHEWGLDHGAWTVVRRMYPTAEIPVLQFSIDYTKDAQFHYELSTELKVLRKKGVLVIGSGNMVHNLRTLDWSNPESGYDWALEMNDTFRHLIMTGKHSQLINYEALGSAAKLSIPTPEHYLPMIYILGLKDKKDSINFFNDKTVMGSVSMTSFQLNPGH
jgi:4,5-DOPA dioxygenase extradiol